MSPLLIIIEVSMNESNTPYLPISISLKTWPWINHAASKYFTIRTLITNATCYYVHEACLPVANQSVRRMLPPSAVANFGNK